MNDNLPASSKFWKLEQRINLDKEVQIMKCDKCKKNEVKIVIQGVGNFCMDCNNEMMAEELDVKLFKEFNKELAVIDSNGEYHIFEISNHVMPGFSKWEACEKDGYTFEVMIGTDEDQESGFKELQLKIFSGLSYKSLHSCDMSTLYDNAIFIDGKQFGLNSVGTGVITSDSTNDDDTDHHGIVIDGHFISFNDFGRMTSAYSGFTMEYQFRDATEEPLSKNMAFKKVDISKEAVLLRFNRYQEWLLEENVLPYENESAYFQAMKECIGDLDLMLISNLRDACKEVAEIMIAKLDSVKSESQKMIDQLIDKIEQEIWFM